MAEGRSFRTPVSNQWLRVATAKFTMSVAVMAKILSLPGRKVEGELRASNCLGILWVCFECCGLSPSHEMLYTWMLAIWAGSTWRAKAGCHTFPKVNRAFWASTESTPRTANQLENNRHSTEIVFPSPFPGNNPFSIDLQVLNHCNQPSRMLSLLLLPMTLLALWPFSNLPSFDGIEQRTDIPFRRYAPKLSLSSST